MILYFSGGGYIVSNLSDRPEYLFKDAAIMISYKYAQSKINKLRLLDIKKKRKKGNEHENR